MNELDDMLHIEALEAAADLSLDGKFKEAAEAYARIGEAGSWYAKIQLGFILQNGVGVEKDVAKAETLFRSAKAQGSTMGQYFLANLLEKTKRREEAFSEMRAASNFGYLPAINRLGIYFLEGIGCVPDVSAGVHYRSVAASRGHLFAQQWLAKQQIRDRGWVKKITGLNRLMAVSAKIFWFTMRRPADPRVQP